MPRLKHWRRGRRPFSARTAHRGADHGPAKPVRRTVPNCSLFRLLGSASAAGFMRAMGVAVVAAPLALVSHNSLADEGGSSFWNPGSFASLAAAPLQPGLSLTSIYYHPSVSSGKDVARAQRIRTGRYPALLLSAVDENTDTTKNQGMVTPTYTFATPVLGGQANVSMTAVYSNNTTTLYELFGNVVRGGPVAFFSALNETTSDTVTAFGDLSPQVSLRWNAGVHNIMTYATGNIPVGQYNPSNLANIGIGHGALDGGAGYTYFDKAGREFSAVAGLTYNFIDPYTQYQNGIDFHLDWAASQFLSKQLQIGVVGYIPRTPRESEDPPCQTARSGFYRTDDTARLSGHRIAAKPDRVGSGRVGRSSSGPTCERAGVARRWDELRGDCEGPVAGRRHHPHLVSPV